MKPSTLRNVTLAIVVLGLIGGVILGFKFKTIEIGYFSTEEKFNLVLMLSTWIGTAMYAVPCFALASALENQEQILSELWKFTHNKQFSLNDPETSNATHSAPPPVRNTSETWTCKNCGERNPRSARICKSCGQDK